MKKKLLSFMIASILGLSGCSSWKEISEDPVGVIKAGLSDFIVEEIPPVVEPEPTPTPIPDYTMIEFVIGQPIYLFPGDEFNTTDEFTEIEIIYERTDESIQATLLVGTFIVKRPNDVNLTKITWADYSSANMELLEYYCRENFDLISSAESLKMNVEFDLDGINCITLLEGKCKIYKKIN